MNAGIHHFFSYGLVSLLTVIIIANNTFSKEKSEIPKIFYWLIALVLWIGLSALFSDHMTVALNGFFRLAFFVLSMLGLYFSIGNDKMIKNILISLILSGLTIALSIFIEFVKSDGLVIDGVLQRFGGLAEVPNISGYILGITFMISLMIKNKVFKTTMLTLLGAALIITFSRSAWLMVAVSLVLYLVIKFKPVRINKYYIIPIIILLIVGGFLLRDKLYVLLRLKDGLLTYRDYIWEAGMKIFVDHPFWGIGQGCSRFYILDYINSSSLSETGLEAVSYGSTHLHSMFLTILAELGVIGFVLSFIIIYSIIRQLWTSKFSNENIIIIRAIFIGFLVRSFFESGGLLASGWMAYDIYLWLIILIALKLVEKSNIKNLVLN